MAAKPASSANLAPSISSRYRSCEPSESSLAKYDRLNSQGLLTACGRLECRATVKPRVKVQHSSSTEISKERLVTASHCPGGSRGTRWSMPAKKLITLPCVTTTPLGWPVEPDV